MFNLPTLRAHGEKPPRRFFAVLPALSACALAAFAAGCARVPANDVVSTGKLLFVTMTVRGQIQPSDSNVPYYYFALINRTDTISDPGPSPVVDRPWGNGFAAASQTNAQGFVGFVRYDRFQGQGGYGVYSTLVGGQLLNPVQNIFTPLGQPDTYRTPQAGEQTLTFQIDLGRLPNPSARYVQVNLLATNNLPQGAEDAPKVWDALGNGSGTGFINGYVTLDTTQNIIRRNSDLIGDAQEPSNDTRDHLGPLTDEPNLDIVDWTLEIRQK